MNSFFLIFIVLPALEIFLFIQIGGEIGALNTIAWFFNCDCRDLLCKITGTNFKIGITNLYQNKAPIYEIMSGLLLLVHYF